MTLLAIFDDISARGNNLIYEYLSAQFPTTLLQDNIDLVEQIKKHPAAKCLFTTSSQIAQTASPHITTVLFINDPCESYCSRRDNISNWRQNLSTYRGIDNIFVASSALATSFVNTFRTPCKVQYPYVPKMERGTPIYVLYNKYPPHMHRMYDFAPNELFMMYSKVEDFKDAKVYIHIPDGDEQWHVNLMLAHAHGVPCITYKQGCFSEFCTSGDKLLPCGADANTWISNFKVAMRDHAINSKIVYEMSQRFNAMNEVQQRIKRALLENGMLAPPPTFSEIQDKANIVKDPLKRLQARRGNEQSAFTQKIVRPTRALSKGDDYPVVRSFLSSNTNVYAGVGGLGDALLALSTAFGDPKASMIFSCNAGVREVVRQLFETFDMETLLVHNFNGNIEGMLAWSAVLDHPNFKGCGHIPRDLNYGDWSNNAKFYLDKTVKRMPLVKKLGKLVNPRDTKKVIGLSPRGSDHTSSWKQRYLNRDEYNLLVKKLLSQNATVIVFGSEEDMNYYGVYQDNNVIFMNSNFAVSHPAPRYSISMRHMLTAINGCDLIISVDTWLKTYAALAEIPCKVIMNRYFGKSSLEHQDPSDNIFLDPLVWGFEIVPLERLLV
jgi:hypothetical protein